ncbi:14842_t:CDS:2, partial [Gigaspora rosea]
MRINLESKLIINSGKCLSINKSLALREKCDIKKIEYQENDRRLNDIRRNGLS